MLSAGLPRSTTTSSVRPDAPVVRVILCPKVMELPWTIRSVWGSKIERTFDFAGTGFLSITLDEVCA